MGEGCVLACLSGQRRKATYTHMSPVHAPTPPGILQLSYLFLAVLLVAAYRLGPTLSRLTRLPLITLYMLGGVVASHSGLLAEQVLEQLIPVHEAALACITFAAGSELVMEQLRADAVSPYMRGRHHVHATCT